MKVTVLIENTSNSSLICEHGLSLWIEYQDKKILLDAGSSEAFAANAKALGVDLSKADVAVLSHGHYDHSGGFAEFFRENEAATVFAMDTSMQTYYSGNGGMHEIGVPQEVKVHRNRFTFVNQKTQIFPGVTLIPHDTNDLEQIGKKAKLYREDKGEIVPDSFAHEMSLVFDLPEGLVIFNSCSHAGVSSIIQEVRRNFEQKKVYAYVGGLHMKGKANGQEICTFSEAEMDSLCSELEREEVSCVYTGHCTGLVGLELLRNRLGNRIQGLTTGMKIEW